MTMPLLHEEEDSGECLKYGRTLDHFYGHVIMGDTALFLVLLQDTCLENLKQIFSPHGDRGCF